MNEPLEYKLAYEILPAVRMSRKEGKPWIIRLDNSRVMQEASRSEEQFVRWKDAQPEKKGVWLALEEKEDNREIIRKIGDILDRGHRIVMLQNAGLITAGDNFREINKVPGHHAGATSEQQESAVKNRIVVVTGAAQGFGLGLARHFAADGACVVVADINRETGEKSVEQLIEETGNEAIIFVPVDVTDSRSVDAMIRQTVFAFGGLDLYVSNAGVLKAGGLETLEEEAFDFLTKVNYKGLYLGTKYASRVMKTQHAFRPGYFMDIIQINSKSGLQGSNRNFAYAGSKFGSIGLIQSFALELVTENIKVNAVCPGNFFDGPLWSDPENGLFVQYLKTGKVAGAKTIEDVRRHYENLVPMKRGCFVVDVYRAVKYLVEQEYETGQALPVTGGQVMLK